MFVMPVPAPSAAVGEGGEGGGEASRRIPSDPSSSSTAFQARLAGAMPGRGAVVGMDFERLARGDGSKASSKPSKPPSVSMGERRFSSVVVSVVVTPSASSSAPASARVPIAGGRRVGAAELGRAKPEAAGAPMPRAAKPSVELGREFRRAPETHCSGAQRVGRRAAELGRDLPDSTMPPSVAMLKPSLTEPQLAIERLEIRPELGRVFTALPGRAGRKSGFRGGLAPTISSSAGPG